MNIEVILLFTLSCIGLYVKIKYGLIIIAFWLISLISNFFLTTFGMMITVKEIPESEIFYISKKSNYENLYPYLKEFRTIKKKFNLPCIYKPFGIFYDNPAKNQNKLDQLRCVIGIIAIKDNENENEKKIEYDDKKFKEYMKSQNFKSINLPKCKGIFGEYESILSIINSFLFIAKLYIRNINQKFFTRLYNPEWKNTYIKNARRNYNKKYGILEIMDNKKMNIFIPTEKEKHFNIYYE